MQKNFEITVDTVKGVRNQALVVNTNDLKTLKFSITITQHNQPVDLTGSTVRIAIKKPDKKSVFQDCTIGDAKTGKCEVILTTQAYIVPGLHAVEVMVYFAADTVAVTGRFSYTSTKGLLDDESIASTNEFQALNKAITDVEDIVVDLRENGTGIDAQARQDIETHASLLAQRPTQDELAGALAPKTDKTYVDAELNKKVEQAYVDTLISNITDGSPKELFYSIASLNAAYPSGTIGPMLVFDSTHTDGAHSYIWNGTSWVDTGVYQSTGISDYSVTTKKRTVLGEQGIIITKYPVNINTVAKTLEFPTSGYIGINYQNKNVVMTTALLGQSIPLTTGSNAVFIAFNTSTNQIDTFEFSASLQEHHVLLGYIIFEGTNGMFLNASYTVDGKSWVADESITSTKTTSLGNFAMLSTTRPLNIDTINGKIEFPSTGYIGLIYKNKNISSASWLAGKVIDFPSSGFFLKVDVKAREVSTVSSTSSLKEDDMLLGFIFQQVDSICLPGVNYTINQGSLSALGDSITYGDNGQGTGNTSNSWTAYVPVKTVNNVGKNGSRIAITDGKTDSFVERFATIPSAAIISLWGGINDFQNNVPLGTIESTENTTFYGACKTVFKGICENNPDSKVFVMTPMKKTHGYGMGQNAIGLYLKDYVNAIKEVADLYSIPVLDMYSHAGISPFIASHVPKYFADGIHPTNDGYKRIAKTIGRFIENL